MIKPSHSSSFRHHSLVIGSIAVLAFVLYGQTLNYDFVFDDGGNIVRNEGIRITSLTPTAFKRAAKESQIKNRPVANISFALNHYFSEYDPAAYRLTNVVIHLITGVLVYVFAFMTLRLLSASSTADPLQLSVDRQIPAAAAIALIWLAHPIQIQSVTYIVQRMASMATMFYMAAFCAYIQGRCEQRRNTMWFSLSGVCWLLALGCKEIAATLPIALFMYEWVIFQRLDKAWLKRSLKYGVIPLALAAVAALIFLGKNPVDRIAATYTFRDYNAWERVLTQGRVVTYYLSLMLYPLPDRFHLDTHFPHSLSPFRPIATIATYGLLAVLTFIAVRLARRWRLLALCAGWVIIHLLIESSVIGLEMAYEHRMYLPSIGLIMAIVLTVWRFLPAQQMLRRCLLGGTLLALAASTWARNPAWKDPVTVWQDCARKSPNKARPHTNLGRALRAVGKIDAAIAEYRKAIELNPKTRNAHNNLGAALREQGDLDGAIKAYETAIELYPMHATAHHNLAGALVANGQREQAVTHFLKTLELEPNHDAAHYNLGAVMMGIGKFDDGVRYMKAALSQTPGRADAMFNIGRAYAAQDKHQDAVDWYQKAIQHSAKQADFYLHLGKSQRALKAHAEAERSLSTAMSLKPGSLDVRLQLADTHLAAGDHDNALTGYMDVLNRQPNNRHALNRLQKLAELTKRPSLVSDHFRRQTERAPNNPAVHIQLARHLFQTNHTEASIAPWKKAIALAPNNAGAHIGLADAYMKLQRHDQALAQYAVALKHNAKLIAAHNNMAAIFVNRKAYEEAAGHYRKALAIDPNYSSAKRNLKIVLDLMNESTK